MTNFEEESETSSPILYNILAKKCYFTDNQIIVENDYEIDFEDVIKIKKPYRFEDVIKITYWDKDRIKKDLFLIHEDLRFLRNHIFYSNA